MTYLLIYYVCLSCFVVLLVVSAGLTFQRSPSLVRQVKVPTISGQFLPITDFFPCQVRPPMILGLLLSITVSYPCQVRPPTNLRQLLSITDFNYSLLAHSHVNCCMFFARAFRPAQHCLLCSVYFWPHHLQRKFLLHFLNIMYRRF